MEVLILSKTVYGQRFCIGGILLKDLKPVRLLYPGGYYPSADTSFNIGDVWDIEFVAVKEISEPHNEDVVVRAQNFLRKQSELKQFILNMGVPIWNGHIEKIFDSKLTWPGSGKGYLSKNRPDFPQHSTGFWINDKPLKFYGEHYSYPTGRLLITRKLKYKGVPGAVNTIPDNSLIRVSLAKWWLRPDSNDELRCYAQLSGWYS